MAAKTPNALLHGSLDALILKTLAGGPRHGYAIAKFIEDASGDTVENVVLANIRYQAAELTARSEIVRAAVAAGTLRVAGARYDLHTAEVTLVPTD